MNKLLLIAIVGIALPVHASMYKCTESNGRVSYQEAPCEAGSAAKRLNIVVVPPANQTESDSEETASVNEGMKAVKSIYLISNSVNTSASARKDGMKVSVIFKDDKDRSVSVKGAKGIRYSAKIHEALDGKPGRMIGSGSGLLIGDYGYYFVTKVSATTKTRVIIEASVTLPDGRKLDGKDSAGFYPDGI